MSAQAVNRKIVIVPNTLCCCGKLKVYLVTGLGHAGLSCSVSSVAPGATGKTKAYDMLREWLRVEQDQFLEIINHTRILGLQPHSTTVTEIQNVIKRREALCSCGLITTIFIAHSHGAACLYTAIESLSGHPRTSAKYFDQMALLSIGGIQIFPRDAAKISKNFHFTNDIVISKLKYLWWKEKPDECDVITLGPFVRNTNAFSDVTCDCCKRLAGVPLVERAEHESPASLSASQAVAEASPDADTLMLGGGNYKWIKAHFLHDYVCCRTLQIEIKRCFGL